MSLFLDTKYLNLISNRLPLFKRKDDSLYNCRCIICGDSAKHKNKTRGYFFKFKNELRYKCHNCGASQTFNTFLKNLDASIYSQYVVEKYSEGNNVKISNTMFTATFDEPKFKSKDERLLDKILDRLDTLPEDNEAVVFCNNRQVPKEQFKKLYFIPNIKDIVQLSDKYKESIKGEEPRLVLPFYNEDGQLTGVTCRALRGEALRYITVKIKDDQPLLFGVNELKKTEPVYLVEGPIDSLFLPNAIAANGTSFTKAISLGLDVIGIFDNQPRNVEVCKLLEKFINSGNKVVIWPQNLQQKDINDMVIAGKDILKLVKENTFAGLTAKAKFTAWKRC